MSKRNLRVAKASICSKWLDYAKKVVVPWFFNTAIICWL